MFDWHFELGDTEGFSVLMSSKKKNEDQARDVAEKLEERREAQIENRDERIGKKEDASCRWIDAVTLLVQAPDALVR